jgi:uncharacterized GH25 family protein
VRVRLALPAALVALLATPVFAHDFWIEASSFRPAVGSAVTLRLFVGPNFEGEPFPRVPNLISRFVLVSAGGERDIQGRAGADPAGVVRIESPGMQIVAYRSLNYALTVNAAKFEEYLAEEGLEKISALRKTRGDAGKPGREVFSRCAKALLEAPGDGGKDRAVGLTLELVAEKNPYTLAPGDELPVRLLLENKPLAGALVHGLLHGDPSVKVAGRTDRSGRVKLKLARPGLWLIKAVEMSPAPAGVDADWQSLWASLTFENGARNPVGKAP